MALLFRGLPFPVKLHADRSYSPARNKLANLMKRSRSLSLISILLLSLSMTSEIRANNKTAPANNKILTDVEKLKKYCKEQESEETKTLACKELEEKEAALKAAEEKEKSD